MSFSIIIQIIILASTIIYAIISISSSAFNNFSDASSLQFSTQQLHQFLLAIISLVIIFDILSKLKSEYEFAVETSYPRKKQDKLSYFLPLAWWVIAILLFILSITIAIPDFLGFAIFPDIPPTLKVLTTLTVTVYVVHKLDRNHNEAKSYLGALKKTGRINVISRHEDHDRMSEMLDNIDPFSQLFVTHFEEPQNPAISDGESTHYYEDEFMKKWFSTIKEKSIQTKQILLINSIDDVDAMEKRIDVTRDIHNYEISAFVNPPMLVFIDFIIVPNQFVIIGMSNDRNKRNLNEFGILLTDGPIINKFLGIFNNILWTESIPVKTFEGINDSAISQIRHHVAEIKNTENNHLQRLYNPSPIWRP